MGRTTMSNILNRLQLALAAIFTYLAAGAQISLAATDTITGTKLERQLLGKDSTVWQQPMVKMQATTLTVPIAFCGPGTYQLSFLMGGQQLSATVLLETGTLNIRISQHGKALSPDFTGTDGNLNTAYNSWKAQESMYVEVYRHYAQLCAAYGGTENPTRHQLEAWWRIECGKWETYKQNLRQQWAGHALATVVASTWGCYYAAYPTAYRNQLLAQLPSLADLRFNAHLIEAKEGEYLRLLFPVPSKSADEMTDTLLAHLPELLDKGMVNDSLLRYWCLNIRKQAMQGGLDAVQELIDARYLSAACTADGGVDLRQRLAAHKNTRTGMLAPKIVADRFDLCRLAGADSTLVVFWASWCAHCLEELPILYKKLAGRTGIQVVAVGLDGSGPAWEVARQQFPAWQHVRAPKKWDDANVAPYGIYAMPTMFLLDKERHILGTYGSIDAFLERK